MQIRTNLLDLMWIKFEIFCIIWFISAPLECEPDFIPCLSVQQCIWSGFWCDGSYDCKDFSDEADNCTPKPPKQPKDCEYFVSKLDKLDVAGQKVWPDGTKIEWAGQSITFTYNATTAVSKVIATLQQEALVEISAYDGNGKLRGPPTVNESFKFLFSSKQSFELSESLLRLVPILLQVP